MKALLLALLIFNCVNGLVVAQSNNWHYLPNNGLDIGNRRLEDVFFTNTHTGFAVTLGSRLYKTTDGGTNWRIMNDTTDDMQLRSIEFLNDGVVGVTGGFGNPGRVWRTDDAGENWTEISQHIYDSGPYGKQMCGLSHIGDTFYGVGWYGGQKAKFYKSIDKGLTWTTTILDTLLATYLVDVHFISADTGFVSGGRRRNAGSFFSGESVILRTTDGGLSWSKVFSDTLTGGWIWKLQALTRDSWFGAIQPYFSDTVAMVKSTNGGNTWTIVGTGYRRPSTQGVGFVSEQVGWLGGYYLGLIETRDGGQTWDSIGFGARFNRFFVLDSNRVYAGGAAVYRYGDSANFHLDVTEPVVEPTHKLIAISPNPASGVIKIEFILKTETNVVLEVANLTSRTIANIERNRLPPGRYTYYWDGTNAPNGTYMVWLGTDEIPFVQKFVLRR